MISWDINKLTELMKSFYTLAGIKIAVFDDDYHEIAAYPEGHCAYCAKMHHDQETAKKCFESDRAAFLKCQKEDKLIIYVCHAGLIEAVVPLKDNGVTVAYIMFGQITNDQQLSCERDVIYKSKDQIHASGDILEACMFSVYYKEMISLERQNFAERLNDYIMTHLAEDLSVEHLCQELRISHTRIYEISNQYLGMGLAKYIRKIRIREAKRYLRDTLMSVTEISEKCGFRDYNYFCRVFKEETGLPAKRFRKLYQS